jgi:hypothetical protein
MAVSRSGQGYCGGVMTQVDADDPFLEVIWSGILRNLQVIRVKVDQG